MRNRVPFPRLWRWFLAAALLGALLAGCAGTGGGGKAQAAVVVLVDVTSSTVSAKPQYLAALDKVLDQVPDGARLVILPIDVDSTLAQPAFDKTFPRLTNFSLDPKAGNTRMQTKDRDKLRSEAKAAMQDLVDRPRSTHPGTAIIGGLEYAGKIFAAVPSSDRYIVILSDMIEQTEYDFTGLKDADIDYLIGRLKEQKRLPALNAQVYVGGQSAGEPGGFQLSDDQVRRIKTFWDHYFQATGAQVKWYGPSLLQFCARDTQACSSS